MFWVKRALKASEFPPYQHKMQVLLLAFPLSQADLIMVSVATEKAGQSICYVGVPLKEMLWIFDGFERVDEDNLPRQIDAVWVADQTQEPFTTRFQLAPP